MKKYFNPAFTFLFGILFILAVSGMAKEKKMNLNKGIKISHSLKREKDFVPAWAKKVIWYQIFPERFRNGDSGNDPKIENLKGSWPHDSTSPWQIHPWTSDWYELQPYEKENGKDIWYNLQRRRYGGDLQGIIDKLDYLQELGVTGIYLNPVFESPSLHKYDGATYHHIDPNFGPDPEGDRKLIASETFDDPSTWIWTSADKLFLKLVDEVHKRNIHIIIDGVFNHMGINSFPFQDVKKNQQKSKYKNWFTIKSWDDTKAGTKFEYEGWFGVKELPEIREDGNGIVAEPKQYIFNATKRWMDPDGNGNTKTGIDGWRLDVAFCVSHNFWKDWRIYVKSINPEAYMTGEVFEDSLKKFTPYLKGDEFDAIMDYPWLYTCSEYFVDEIKSIPTSKFVKLLKELRDLFPECVSYVQQNLVDSHDTHRLASHIVNKDLAPFRKWNDFFTLSKAENPKYNTRKPNESEREIQKLIILFQMTYLGAPMVYYGDEAGMWGANDPCCRKPMVWPDMKYQDEVFLPDQSKKELPDKVEFDNELFSYYKRIIAIRNSFPALQLGDFKPILVDDENAVLAFERNYKTQEVIVVINNSKTDQQISLNVKKINIYKDIWNGDTIYKPVDGKFQINLSAKRGAILIPSED
jgi:cyclomaltodextrinase / maltogenic alpha-amylase / neopullulanase